ncbi:uncharacterized protein TEOVI_000501100 [Trypanosoma equiperdum]|uniref:Uncharacterized protein n=3 Tax=Trypanozoon TaxID=39700 RepID=Q381E1_TRYB2|nr:hypothetical protein, conserved [Trypanosoma brucei gambiense DAL972]XP_829702.1 hypothetical protein, conserved [Trypanosoma brucei brucei TREU927]EAN80590.1 hypothetical protein, conserved [Trypanosoma brucei brucei TREU927]CBH18729.1 hypothetical protein, conserved [Trypanosoma brucei gambiense DAL972]SCU67334.1 hypothetical protein, conserved [Trypanosoma equiperdum]|eukprot:XP_011780993.1 hypothetical protein, conserved [Trypanosoma brucei gambiense DAL972]
MVSKTRRQRQKRKSAMDANGGVLPPVIPSERKSVHLKKTRPKMKGKMKIRLGHESPVDIYEGFEERKGVLWRCPTCTKECRVMGFCVDCASGRKSRVHTGVTMSRHSTAKKEVSLPVSSGVVKKKLKLKKKVK